jgi:molybdenum cofactor guanylyltransferase
MTPATASPPCGLILAGGHSTRMGADKAALMHPDGRSLARRAHDLLEEAGCATIVLSLRHDQGIPPGFGNPSAVEIARDPEGGGEGPIAGMIAAMSLHPHSDWLVLACDLPRLDAATLRHLLDSQLPDELLLSYRSEHDGLPEPLCALYGKGAVALLQQEKIVGIRCPRKFLIRHHCRLLEPITPRALENANTPDEWRNALAP